MAITVYGINNCDTVKKARRWLEKAGVDYRFHDLRKDGLVPETLDNWLHRSDWETLLNRRSTTWKNLSDKERDQLDSSRARQLMLANPTLIKRPVTVTQDAFMIGFSEAEYRQAFTPRG